MREADTEKPEAGTRGGKPAVGQPRPRMRHNFYWTISGNVLYTGSQWGILVALAKLGTPELVGLFGLGLAITAPVVMMANLELRSVQATDARREYAFGHYLAVRLVTTALALVVTFGAALVGCRTGEAIAVVLALGLAKAIESYSDLLYGLFQSRERMDRVAISMVIKGVMGLSSLAVAVHFTKSALLGILAMAGAWTVVLLAYDLPAARNLLASEPGLDPEGPRGVPFAPTWDWPRLRKLAVISFPLGLMMMLVSLNINIPRYFIQAAQGERQLGFFVAVAYIVVAITTVVNALGQAASPRLAAYYLADNRSKAFRTLLAKMVAIIAILSTVGVAAVVVAGGPILSLLYRPEYASVKDVFLWLMIASGLQSIGTVLRYGAISARKFNELLLHWGGFVAVNLVACWVLIPRFGSRGGAMALALSAIAQILGHLWILRPRGQVAPVLPAR